MAQLKLSHNDDVTLRDSFGNEAFLEGVCRVISDCEPPKGIGINGYWGTGKTSALSLVHYHLTNTCPRGGSQPEGLTAKHFDEAIVPIWFEAWRYQHDPTPIVALLNEIRAQMGLWQKAKKKAGKLASVALRGSFAIFDDVIKVASGGLLNPNLGKLQEVGTAWEQEHHQQPLPSQLIANLLEEAITVALDASEPHERRLVIFIDDLDRCQPATALRLLEGIKVYLNLSNCVVVFGMDQRQIERALAELLPNANASSDRTTDHQAREYLEKICQDIYHLPIPNKRAKADFLRDLLHQLNVGEHRVERLAHLYNLLQAYDCLPANPRKIKALANRLAWILRQLDATFSPASFKTAATAADPIAPDLNRQAALLLMVCILYCFHRPVYEQLEKNPGYVTDVVTFTAGSTSVDTLLQDRRFEPMRGIVPSRGASGDLPVNPSDSNVFRLHQLFQDLDGVEPLTADEIRPFLGR